MNRLAIVASVLACLATCTFNPHPRNGEMRCGSGSPVCPDGYTCQDEYCWEDGTGPGSGSGTDKSGSGGSGGNYSSTSKSVDCGGGCPTGMTCVDNRCQCMDAQATSCGSSGCAVLSTDSRNCGSCGNRCPSAQVCRSGNCVCATSGEKLCSGSCVDTSYDSSNCGSCGRTCPSAQICSAGTCQCSIAGQELCSDACTDTSADSSNCGRCGNDCSLKYANASVRCSSGSCLFASCDSGYANCDGLTQNGCEISISSDSNNCGRCGKACLSTQWCHSGVCEAKAGCKEACVSDDQCAPNLCISTTEGKKCITPGCRVCFDKLQTCYSNNTTCAFDRCETPSTNNTKPNVPATVGNRPTNVLGTVSVKSQAVTFRVWDGGNQIDGDIISLYVNGTKILSQYTLTAAKKDISWHLDYTGYNYIALYAHNEGSVSPNTAALSLFDGKTEQELVLSADLSTCGVYNIVVAK